ncbi:MAG TPA: glycosyltransferase [Thermoanaerobaculia bacterium]|nr:glycosyltransferase [Thermoanaerobaculia bacterium]
MRPLSDEGGAPLRPPIAVLLSRFPLVTETFILREVEELERQGQPVLLVPLLRERPAVVHAEARPWIARALFTPWLSRAIAGANLRALRRRPRAYLACLGRLAAGMARSPGFLVRSLALFPKAVFLAERLAGRAGQVHAHFATHPATVAWVIERLAGIPYGVTVHAHDLFVRRTMLAAKLGRARYVRVISGFNRDFLAERYSEAAGKVEVVHVGVHLDRPPYPRSRPPTTGLGPAVPRGGRTPPPGLAPPEDGAISEKRCLTPELRILTVAALKPYKGLDVLLAAADRLRVRLEAAGSEHRLAWEVVGEGPLRRRLEREIARRGLAGTVRLAGALPQDEVARRLAAADLVVLTSVVAPDGQMEGIPVVLMEALAAGKPAVASRLSGIPELIEDGVTGLLAPPGDPEAVAAAVERLVREPELARRLGAAGRERVARDFRLGTTVAELLALVDREAPAARKVEPAARRIAPAADPALERALRALLAAAGLAGRPIGLRRLREGPDSRVAELLVAAPDGPREVVVKVHRARPGQSAPPAARARREHDLLARLEAAGRGGPYGVPRPLALGGAAGGEADALAMERARGERLDRRLRALRFRPGRRAAATLAADFRRAGAWLRWFRGEVGENRRHGDLWPGNLFVTAERVEGIDLEGCGPGGPWDDAAHFLLHAELYFTLPWPAGRLLGRRFRRLERAFLEGVLGEPPAPAARAALAAVRSRAAAELLDRWRAEGGARPGRQRRRLRRLARAGSPAAAAEAG